MYEEITSRMAEVCLRREAPENQKRALNLNELVADVKNNFLAYNEALESNVRSELAALKSSEKAFKLLFRGLDANANGAYREAINLFTESVSVAPTESEVLAMAYASRSDLLHRIGKLIESLLDINRALQGKHPENFRMKLEGRKRMCLKDMRKCKQFGVTHYEGNETDPIRVINFEDDDLLDSMCKFGNDCIPRASPKIRLECDEQWGRHLVAVEDIETGEILSRQKFFSTEVMPSTYLENCSHCLVRCYALIPCSSCFEMYCSRDCLLRAREAYHETECKMFRIMSQQSLPKIIDSEAFSAVRALLIGTKQGIDLPGLMKRCSIGDIFAENIDPTNAPFANDYLAVLRMRRTFDSSVHENVMTVLETIVQLRRVGFFENATSNNDARHGTISEDGLNEVELFTAMLLLNHMCTLNTYAFYVYNITDWISTNPAAHNTVGSGVNIVNSLVNHSCSPNASYFVKKLDQLLYAWRPIKKGEQITLSYAGHFGSQPLEERRLEQKRYNFVCQCEACTNNWPDLNTLKKRNNIEEFLDKSLAMVDFKQQLIPLFTRIKDSGLSDLPIDEILQFTCKIVQWIDTHMKRPSPAYMTLEFYLDVFMDLLFDESSREYRNTSEMKKLFVVFYSHLRVLLGL